MNERILSLARRLDGRRQAYGLAGSAEAEVIMLQVVQSAAINIRAGRGAFSFKGSGLLKRGAGGLIDNPKGLSLLKDRGFVEESTTDAEAPSGTCVNVDGRALVLVPTDKLLEELEDYADALERAS